jgi:hypothetical protein
MEDLGRELEKALERCFAAGSAEEILQGDWSFIM